MTEHLERLRDAIDAAITNAVLHGVPVDNIILLLEELAGSLSVSEREAA